MSITPNHQAGQPLAPIDSDALEALAEKNVADPSKGKKKIRTHTEADGTFRNYTQVRDLDPVLVAEPFPLLGDNSAPNPTEVAQAALASCIAVGIQAIATHRGVTLTKIAIDIESDIDISAVWGVGDTDEEKRTGVSDVRVVIDLEGDTDRETLDQIQRDAVKWSPVVNTYTRPANVTSELA